MREPAWQPVGVTLATLGRQATPERAHPDPDSAGCQHGKRVRRKGLHVLLAQHVQHRPGPRVGNAPRQAAQGAHRGVRADKGGVREAAEDGLHARGGALAPAAGRLLHLLGVHEQLLASFPAWCLVLVVKGAQPNACGYSRLSVSCTPVVWRDVNYCDAILGKPIHQELTSILSEAAAQVLRGTDEEISNSCMLHYKVISQYCPAGLMLTRTWMGSSDLMASNIRP